MTDVNLDQQLSLLLASGGSPNVATDQSLALLVQQRLIPQIIFNRADQMLALIIERRTNTSFTFLDPAGRPIANGTLELWLSVDASANGKQILAGRKIVAALDMTGSCTLNLQTNDILSPSGTFYYGVVKTAQGQPVWERQMTISTGGIVTYRT